MNRILSLGCTLLLAVLFNSVTAQTLLSEDFNTTIPTSWIINSTNGATWIHDNSIGIQNSGCMLIDQSLASGVTKGTIETNSVDLTTVKYPTLSFKVAAIRSNFVAPVLNIYYSTGGAWQKLSSWGEFQAGNLINTSGPCSPKVSTACATWVTITYDLTAVANNANIRFAFEGDLINGGWLMIDDLKIAERKVYTLPYSEEFENEYFMPEDWQQRGVPSTTFVQWQHEKSVGSFNSTSCMKFDNMNSNVDSTFALDMVWFDFTNISKPTLKFDYAYAKRIGKPSDELSIWYQVGSAGAPTKLVEYKDNSLTTTFDKANHFVPNNREWLTKTIDLPQFAGVKDIRFSFRNKSQNSNTIYIDDVRFYDDATTSVGQRSYGNNIELYPNPAQDKIFIDINNARAAMISVFDISGKPVSSVSYIQQEYRIVVNTSTLSNGMYYIKVQKGVVSVYKKFIINK